MGYSNDSHSNHTPPFSYLQRFNQHSTGHQKPHGRLHHGHILQQRRLYGQHTSGQQHRIENTALCPPMSPSLPTGNQPMGQRQHRCQAPECVPAQHQTLLQSAVERRRVHAGVGQPGHRKTGPDDGVHESAEANHRGDDETRWYGQKHCCLPAEQRADCATDWCGCLGREKPFSWLLLLLLLHRHKTSRVCVFFI